MALSVISRGGLRGEQLGHARLEVGAPARVVRARRVQQQLLGGGQLGRHVGEQVADRLVLPDGLAEALAVLRVAHGVLEGGTRDAGGAGGHLDAADLEPLHELREALALHAAEHGGPRHPVVAEGDLAALDALVAELGQVAADLEAGAVLAQQDAHAAVRRVGARVGADQDGQQRAAAGVGDPRLRAVDDVVVAVLHGRGAQRLQVGAATGLGERHRGAHLAGRHPGEVVLLLLLGAHGEQQLGHHGVPAHGTGQAHPAARELLGDHRVAGGRDGDVAVRLGDRQPEDPELLHLLDERLGVGVRVLELAGHGLDRLVDEVADEVDDLLLLAGQS